MNDNTSNMQHTCKREVVLVEEVRVKMKMSTLWLRKFQRFPIPSFETPLDRLASEPESFIPLCS